VVQQTSGTGYGFGILATYHRLETDKLAVCPNEISGTLASPLGNLAGGKPS